MAENIYIDKFSPAIPNNPPSGMPSLNPAIQSGTFFFNPLPVTANWPVPPERWIPKIPDLYLLPPKLLEAIQSGAFFYSPDEDDVILKIPKPDKWLPELPDLYLIPQQFPNSIRSGSLFQESNFDDMWPYPDKWVPELPDLYLKPPELLEAIKAVYGFGDIPRTTPFIMRTEIPGTWLSCKITALTVDSMNIVYLGTDKGEVYKYNCNVLTRLESFDGAIKSISIYGSGLLYITTTGGKMYSLTTS